DSRRCDSCPCGRGQGRSGSAERCAGATSREPATVLSHARDRRSHLRGDGRRTGNADDHSARAARSCQKAHHRPNGGMAMTDDDATPLGLDPSDLDGHTIEELTDYLDAGREPANSSIDSSAGCVLALDALERLRALTPALMARDEAAEP